MKAVILERLGGPENLRLADWPDPKPGPEEVLVRVKACGLNHLDLWVRQGIPAYKITLPHILGSDASGEVAALGEGTSGVSVGDRVSVHPGRGCGRCGHCFGGRENHCASYGIMGAGGGPGAYAQYLVAPRSSLLPLPENLSFEEGAAYPLTFLTAWHMLTTLAVLRAGETLLVMGAGSGVGVAAIQIAQLCGARVIAASRSEAKLAKAREAGADWVVQAPPKDVLRETRRITGGRMVDVVFEHVGPAVFESALKSLRPGGRLVTCGATTGPQVTLDLRYVFSRELSIMGAKMGSRAEMEEVSRLVAAGKLRPIVDKIFPLKDAAAAHRYLADSEHFGKVVLSV